MPAVKVLARGWKLEIDTGTTTPTWTQIKGISSFTFSNGKNDADTTDFDSNGNQEHIVASRNRTLSAEGFYLEDAATKTRDVGQQAIEDAGVAIGTASIKKFRLTSPAGIKREFSASVNVGDTGGGNDDPTSWGFELTVSGTPIITNT